MERRAALDDDFPVIPYAASVVLPDEDTIRVGPRNVCFSAERTVTAVRTISGDNVHIALADVIPADVLRRTDPVNVCITHVTLQFIVSKPARNETVTVTLLATTAAPAPALWQLLATAPGPLYRFPVLCMQRVHSDLEPFVVNISRTSSPPEINRMLLCANIRQHCTAQSVLQSRCSTVQPERLELVPRPPAGIPLEFLLGHDTALLILEYLAARTHTSDALDGDRVRIPLFRRTASDAFVPTQLGFWFRYFADVAAERRAHVLPMPPAFYVPAIDECEFVCGDMLSTAIIVPRAAVVCLYTNLARQLADEAAARFYEIHQSRAALVAIIRSDGALEEMKVAVSISYRVVLVNNAKHTAEALENFDDARAAAPAAAFMW